MVVFEEEKEMESKRCCLSSDSMVAVVMLFDEFCEDTGGANIIASNG